MADTDSPLKRLLEIAATDIASWLLGQEVVETTTINIELPADVMRVDQLFRAVLAGGRVTLVNIEFQGHISHRPMQWRMLECMARIATSEPDLDLFTAVFYVGQAQAQVIVANIR